MAAPLGRNQPRSGTSANAEWTMLLAPYGERVLLDSTVDTNTLASARTSDGASLSVYLRRAAPPLLSRICVPTRRYTTPPCATVVAAHGDSVLIHTSWCYSLGVNYFVYNVGAAEGDGGDRSSSPRPPSLSLLESPPAGLTRRNRLEVAATGLLRRGQDELVLAMLQMVAASVGGDDAAEAEPEPKKKAAELVLFRSGEWTYREEEALVSPWSPPATGTCAGSTGPAAACCSATCSTTSPCCGTYRSPWRARRTTTTRGSGACASPPAAP
ncbi:hypothetical protein PR202_gb01168 [Eleusine coracana subsp. coracana]|uniref:Uncharacterized protein n=1 Tax=Eleusine coracana subsp. coracana TaxID=191504 RepID=A0AAV5DWR5_ELECO|nr:hypothetical protein PR202_gb01168 [Eleusine coracana subsp. coracana]